MKIPVARLSRVEISQKTLDSGESSYGGSSVGNPLIAIVDCSDHTKRT